MEVVFQMLDELLAAKAKRPYLKEVNAFDNAVQAVINKRGFSIYEAWLARARDIRPAFNGTPGQLAHEPEGIPVDRLVFEINRERARLRSAIKVNRAVRMT